MKKRFAIFMAIFVVMAMTFSVTAIAGPRASDMGMSKMHEKAVEATGDVDTGDHGKPDDAGKPDDVGMPDDAGDHGEGISGEAKALHELDKPLSDAAKGLGGRP